MDKIECFKIRIAELKEELDLVGSREIIKIKCNSKMTFSEPTTIVADPFLFVKDDTLFLFFEDKKMFHNGVIAMIKTSDLIHWTEPVIVLSEICHLSYPWVFEENGHIYMVPETCGLKEIRLYEANDALDSFKYVKTIMKDDMNYTSGFSFSDTSIYKKDGYYFLMTTINDGKKNILKLYFSDKLDRDYVEHSMSPICIDNRYGRNAGSLIEYKEQLYRVAQNCEKRYGDNINLLMVQKLTTTSYKESVLKSNIIPNDVQFYKEGGHQLNVVKFKDRYIVATDAKEYHYFIFNRIMRKIKKCIGGKIK